MTGKVFLTALSLRRSPVPSPAFPLGKARPQSLVVEGGGGAIPGNDRSPTDDTLARESWGGRMESGGRKGVCYSGWAARVGVEGRTLSTVISLRLGPVATV